MKVVGGNRVATREEIYEWVRTHVRRGEDDCLLWAGAMQRNSPVLVWDGHQWRARRLLIESHGHILLPRHLVVNTCESPSCMNIEHLRWGTKRQVMAHIKRRDSFRRPRPDRGIAIARGLAKRSPKMPLAARQEVEALRAQGLTLREIAERYDVSIQHVSDQLARWRKAFGQQAFAGRLGGQNGISSSQDSQTFIVAAKSSGGDMPNTRQVASSR